MKIIGIDRDRSSDDLNFGDRYLILDEVPSRTWTNFFEDSYRNYFSPMKRKAYLKESYIVVQCPFSELQDQITCLGKIVSSTNERFEAWREAALREAEERERSQEEQKKIADEAYKNLKF